MNLSLAQFLDHAEKANVIPLYKNILSDTETPVGALLKLKKKPVFLLESVVGGEKWARYSFLCFDPILTISGNGRKVTLDNGKEKAGVVADDPLSVVEELLGQFTPLELPELPRFSGGFVGYMSYDIVRRFENLPERKKLGLRMPELLLMLFDTILIFDNLKQTLSILTNVHTGDTVLLRGRPLFRNTRGKSLKALYQAAVRKIDRIAESLQKACVLKPPIAMPQGAEQPERPDAASFRSSFRKEDFKAAVEKCREYILSGDIFQGIVSQRFERPCTVHPFTVYRALRAINPSPYMFYFDIGDAYIVGSSPEILVRLEDGRVTVRPIAGTRKRGKTEEEDKALEAEMHADPKERAEHLMLIDLGRNDVGRVAEIGTVKVTDCMITERYSHVMHMVSNVEGTLREGLNAFNVFRAAFPAGTVTGAPKIRAMEIIEDLEPTKRGVYAGAVGYFSYSGNMDTCIAIRTLVIKDGRVFFQTGAGIVADSVPENEYWESVNKAMAMMTAVDFVEKKKR
ncbi:MAG TPA: anthranilate synthase component I [Dissulfurispiraceae bacterium]|nr:anthranilate synthase component I [Dissulfurispiraceae bacterium]